MGRKPISETPKNSVLVLRISTAEREKMDAVAEGEGKKISAWARDTLVKASEVKTPAKKTAKKK